MATNREIALEQALVAVIGAARSRNIDADDLTSHATALLLGNNFIRWVGHPHVAHAIKEISDAHAMALSLEPTEG